MDVIFLHLALIYSIIFFKSKLIKKQQYLSSLRYSKSKSKSWSNCLLSVSDRSNHCIVGIKSSHILTICPYARQSFRLHLSCPTVSVKLLSCSQWDCLPASLVVSSVKPNDFGHVDVSWLLLEACEGPLRSSRRQMISLVILLRASPRICQPYSWSIFCARSWQPHHFTVTSDMTLHCLLRYGSLLLHPT